MRTLIVLAVAAGLSGCGVTADPYADRMAAGGRAMVSANDGADVGFDADGHGAGRIRLRTTVEIEDDSRPSLHSKDSPGGQEAYDFRPVVITVLDGELKGRRGRIARCWIRPLRER